jgi:hypothetical protein
MHSGEERSDGLQGGQIKSIGRHAKLNCDFLQASQAQSLLQSSLQLNTSYQQD